MAQLIEGCRKLKLEFIPSFANFLTIRVGDAQAVFQKLLKQGVIVRPTGGPYEMPEHLRVTIGLPQENARFLEALQLALKA
jgi:histidinol-phosphate aminotransferase